MVIVVQTLGHMPKMGTSSHAQSCWFNASNLASFICVNENKVLEPKFYKTLCLILGAEHSKTFRIKIFNKT